MALKFRNRGTKIEEEDFCHWTEKDVEFKCLEGLNAELKKFYSWNKAIIIQIEINGTIFSGCLYEDNNSFAPVKFDPPKRPPLRCIIPSKPKPPKRKSNANKASLSNAYSRENWPRVYIDPHNTVEERLRFGRDKNISNNQSNTPLRIGKENSDPQSKKVGVLVHNKRKKSPNCDQMENSAENNSRFHRSERLYNSFCELQQISETNSSETKSNRKSSTELGYASPKGNSSEVTSFRHESKEYGALRKTFLSAQPNLRPQRAKNVSDLKSTNSVSGSNEAKPNLRPQRAKNESDIKFTNSVSGSNEAKPNLRLHRAKNESDLKFTNSVSESNEAKPNLRPQRARNESDLEITNSVSDSNQTLSRQYLLIDLTVSPTECNEIQHQADVIDKSVAINESSVQQISQHPLANPENEEIITIFDSDVLSPTLNVEFASNTSKKVNDLLKSKSKKKTSKKKRSKSFEKECSDLCDKFEKLTIKSTAFGQPVMQSSPKIELDSQGLSEGVQFRGNEMQDSDSATSDSRMTNRPKLFFEKWCFIKNDLNVSSDSQTKKHGPSKKCQTT